MKERYAITHPSFTKFLKSFIMKNLIVHTDIFKSLAIAFVLFFVGSVKATAIPILYSDGNHVDNVMNLPYSEEFEMTYGGRSYHGDLGIMHKRFSIFGVPIWNYGDCKFVLYNEIGDEYVYVNLDEDAMEYLREIYPDIPSEPSLSFWETIGGKLVVLVVLYIIFLFGSEKKNDDDTDTTDTDDTATNNDSND